MTFWTAADDAESAVLVWELVNRYFEHRDRCEACRPEPCEELRAWYAHRADCWKCSNGIRVETPTFGPPCPWWQRHINHGTCKRCNPCPHLKQAIAHVVEWHDARELLSTAEALRALEQTA